MLPLWSQGFFVRSLSYNDPDHIGLSLDQFVKDGFPLQGLALPEETLGGLYNFKFDALVKDLVAKYNTTFNMILPFTPLVPLDTNESDQITANLTVFGGADSYSVQVQRDSTDALCMDALNTDLSIEYLAPLFKRQESITSHSSAFWLNKNTPQLTGNNLTGVADPYANLPYYPGYKSPSAGSLPENALHKRNGQEVSNFYARTVFGSELAAQVQLSLNLNNFKETFILSDDTAPAYSAHYRIAHLFPKQNGSYADLEHYLTNLINFGIYSIPFVGSSLCGYNPNVTDQELCVRYFQLAVISPLAIIDTIDEDFLPYTFGENTKSGVLSALQQRFRFMTYMRSKLYDTTLFGGSTYTPLFAIPTFTQEVVNADDLSTVFWGDSIKVDF